MSFGFSASDFIALGELAFKLYNSCKGSSRTLRNISGELKSLRAVLEESQKTLLVPPPPPDSEARLKVVLDGCREVLNDLQELIDKYESPGAKRSKIRDGVNLYNEKISEIRDRLTSNVTMLTAFVLVGRKVDNYIAMHPPERRPRSIDSQCSADRIAWRKVRKAIGFSLQALEAHKEFIVRRLSHAIQGEALEEKYSPDSESELPLESESAPSNGINFATSDAPSTNSSMELGPATKHHDLRSQNRQLLLPANGSDCETTPECSLQVASIHSSIHVESPSVPLPNPLDLSVSCERCGESSKSNIAFELHMRCKQCSNPNFDICLRCWRLGRGCLGWYGFGTSASDRWGNGECPAPHYFTGRRYRRVMVPKAPTDQDGVLKLIETSDPSGDLQIRSGEFCAICFKLGERYLMLCRKCNCGEWYYCIACVNQGKCCTHPLVPVVLSMSEVYSNSIWYEKTKTAYEHTFATPCHSCALPIPYSENFYHCPECNNGDYDLCKGCYLGLVTSGQISEANGSQGWRRCPEGHRMIIIAYEYSASFQKRILVEGLVGGHARDASELSPASSQHPPSGGLGPSMVALHSFWPNEKERDVLAFPEGAEIQEVQDHNGGWFSGVYCGREGSFRATWASNTAEYSTDQSAPELVPRHQRIELESLDP